MIQKRTRKELYDKFRQGAIPTGADFADLIRSNLNLLEDGINVSEDPGIPISLRARGEEENILDLNDPEERRMWRISARSTEDTTKIGLNIKDDADNSRLYIENETGNIGISTDVPEARLHIRQAGGSDAIRIDDDKTDLTPFVITAEGRVGMGIGHDTDRPGARLHVRLDKSVDDAIPLLRIDDQKIDSTPFIIDKDGNVGVGYENPINALSIEGGVSIGNNTDTVADGSLHVSGNLEIGGSIVLTGSSGSGEIQIDGPIKATSKDFYIEDNVYIVSDPAQAGADGNLSVEGDSTLGTYTTTPGNYNAVIVNGKIMSGYNPQDSSQQQSDLNINEILTVYRQTTSQDKLVTIDGPLTIENTADATASPWTIKKDDNSLVINNDTANRPILSLNNNGDINLGHMTDKDGTDSKVFIKNTTGRVGIGVQNPSEMLEMPGTGNIKIGSTIISDTSVSDNLNADRLDDAHKTTDITDGADIPTAQTVRDYVDALEAKVQTADLTVYNADRLDSAHLTTNINDSGNLPTANTVKSYVDTLREDVVNGSTKVFNSGRLNDEEAGHYRCYSGCTWVCQNTCKGGCDAGCSTACGNNCSDPCTHSCGQSCGLGCIT